MRYYEGFIGGPVDLTQLLTMIRSGQIYSLGVVEVDGQFEIHGEVVVRGKGIQGIKLANYAYSSFTDIHQAQDLLTKAMTARAPDLIDWHLNSLDDDSTTLCGAAKVHRGKEYKTTTIDLFFADASRLGGSRCSRCKTQAHVLGLAPSSSN